jgi:hypothetical protein
MSDFYDYLNCGGRKQPSLPITNSRRPAPPPPPPKATATNLINSANSRIEQAKQALYDKIDVCCAQYGLYGLQIIEQAVTQSLSVMINGGNLVASQRQPQYAPPTPPPPQAYQQPWGYNESYQQPQRQPANYEEVIADSFMNNLGAVMENCDREFDKKAEADMKQRLFEQKQYDMIAAQNRAMPPIDINETLAAHANDFEVTSEEDLRTNV